MTVEFQEKCKFIVGVDMHPDSFAGAAFIGSNIHECKKQWIHSRVSTDDWEKWLNRHIPKNSVIVMEAGCNTFAFAETVEHLGYKVVILESYRIIFLTVFLTVPFTLFILIVSCL